MKEQLLKYIYQMKNKNPIYIIDDDPIHVFLVKKYLQKLGLDENTVTLQNGKEAYDYLKSNSTKSKKLPQLIFLDINMPIWDAWHFLDEYPKLKIEKKITIYLLTSSICKEDYDKAEEYGLNDYYLTKPIAIDKIKEILHLS